MVTVEFDSVFKKRIKKIGDNALKERVKKQIAKIMRCPEIGKPMRFSRKGTREVYIAPFRLSYLYLKEEDVIVFLDLYHKDEQ
jgi:mRNA-degrading endonuclease RelE of RelBE toxin-antitoxin system